MCWLKPRIANASAPELIPGAWPIDVREISRDGISEQRYFSLDEVRVASLRDYREGARANAGI